MHPAIIRVDDDAFVLRHWAGENSRSESQPCRQAAPGPPSPSRMVHDHGVRRR